MSIIGSLAYHLGRAVGVGKKACEELAPKVERGVGKTLSEAKRRFRQGMENALPGKGEEKDGG